MKNLLIDNLAKKARELSEGMLKRTGRAPDLADFRAAFTPLLPSGFVEDNMALNAATVRGKILYYLTLIYPQPATPWLLQGELDLWGYPVSIDDLRLHVALLAEKGFVTVQSYKPPGARVREATLVKITARGIDYYDGRLPADPGIYVEPK